MTIKNNNFKTVVVIGMHRSGTSLVAGIMQCLGVDMGSNLLSGNRGNPLGFFEDEDILDLNKRILGQKDNVVDYPHDLETILNQKDIWYPEIKNIIKEKEGALWGWKDPRSSLTLPLFLPYLNNPYIIVCLRDHKNIADSLKRRDNLDIKKGEEISCFYYQKIFSFLQENEQLKKYCLDYDRIIKNPEKELKGIFDFLEIDYSVENYQQARSFIKS